jgi:hypothetical protein
VHAKGDAIVVPEVEFGQVPMQVPFGTVLINALHSALKHAEIAFHSVRIDVAAHVFLLFMAYEVMLRKLSTNRLIVSAFVSNQPRFPRNILAEKWRNILCA